MKLLSWAWEYQFLPNVQHILDTETYYLHANRNYFGKEAIQSMVTSFEKNVPWTAYIDIFEPLDMNGLKWYRSNEFTDFRACSTIVYSSHEMYSGCIYLKQDLKKIARKLSMN